MSPQDKATVCAIWLNKKMPDYKKSQIYKIVSANHGQFYIGSTTRTLEDRFDEHKLDSNNCSSRLIIGAGGAEIKRIEWFPCTCKHALEDREAQFILNFRNICVNESVPGAERRAGGKKAYDALRYKERAQRKRLKPTNGA